MTHETLEGRVPELRPRSLGPDYRRKHYRNRGPLT